MSATTYITFLFRIGVNIQRWALDIGSRRPRSILMLFENIYDQEGWCEVTMVLKNLDEQRWRKG